MAKKAKELTHDEKMFKLGKIITAEDGSIRAIDLEGTLDQAWEGGEA